MRVTKEMIHDGQTYVFDDYRNEGRSFQIVGMNMAKTHYFIGKSGYPDEFPIEISREVFCLDPEPVSWARGWVKDTQFSSWLLSSPCTRKDFYLAHGERFKVIWPALMNPDGTYTEPE